MSSSIIEYWDEYYRDRATNVEPSDFARFIRARFPLHTRLIDVGCGDGRDTLWFAAQGLTATGLDASKATISACMPRGAVFVDRCDFSVMEIGRDSLSAFVPADSPDLGETLIYARFFLHAITQEEEKIFLADVAPLVARGARLCVEARSVEDAALPKIEAPHYRRFIKLQELEEQCRSLKMDIEFSQSGKGLASYKFEDPAIIRMICRGGRDD